MVQSIKKEQKALLALKVSSDYKIIKNNPYKCPKPSENSSRNLSGALVGPLAQDASGHLRCVFGSRIFLSYENAVHNAEEVF